MGFSLTGLLVALAVLAPNLLLVLAPPRTPLPDPPLPWWLTATERAGQALCLVLPTLLPGTGSRPGWGFVGALALAGYYALWGRYLVTGRRAGALYDARVIPVPMAVLPVVVFAAAAGWSANPWLAAGAVVLAAGHVPASVLRARAVRDGRPAASRRPGPG